MLAFRLNSTSAYEMSKEDTVALVRINLVNEYSGLYYMDGMLKNTANPDDSLAYVMPRNLVATDDGRTVRMFHYNNEWSEGATNDYRPTHTFKITVNPDNTLSYATWNKFEIIDGGGVYNPEYKVYDFGIHTNKIKLCGELRVICIKNAKQKKNSVLSKIG